MNSDYTDLGARQVPSALPAQEAQKKQEAPKKGGALDSLMQSLSEQSKTKETELMRLKNKQVKGDISKKEYKKLSNNLVNELKGIQERIKSIEQDNMLGIATKKAEISPEVETAAARLREARARKK